MDFKFDINGDFKKQFKDAVTSIVRNEIEDVSEKNRLVQSVTDAYVRDIGERPEVSELDELASWIYFGFKGLTSRKKSEVKLYESEEYNKARQENACNYCGMEIKEGERARKNDDYIVVCQDCHKEEFNGRS